MTLTYGTGSSLSYGEEKRTSTSDFAGVPLGTRMPSVDGLRVFRYAFSQGTIGAGQVAMQSAGVASDDMDLVIPAAVAADSSSITVTLGASAVTKNQYQHGYIYINDGAGEGHVYRIQSHEAASGSASATFNLGDDTVAEALTTASLAGLMRNPYQHAELYDANDIDGMALGVAPAEVADNSYFWCQTWGPAAVLAAAAVPVIGKTVSPDASTDGAVEQTTLTEATPNTGGDQQVIGISMLIAPVATDYGMVWLTIAN